MNSKMKDINTVLNSPDINVNKKMKHIDKNKKMKDINVNKKMKDEPTQQLQLAPIKTLSSSPSSPLSESDNEELERMPLAPPRWQNRKRLSKQLSMCERRDIAWEKRRRQILRQERRRNGSNNDLEGTLTDEDMKELKGCIELGFGFNEEKGQQLCNTLPALDLYFAVNRQLSPSPVSTPQSHGSSSASLGNRSESFDSPKSDPDAWKICSPGEDPRQVKTKLRHWAQAVACSLMQSH